MEPTYDPEIIRMYLNGVANEEYLMVKLMTQVMAILIVGIFLWRIASVFAKRSNNRKSTVFSESRFQRHWKNR